MKKSENEAEQCDGAVHLLGLVERLSYESERPIKMIWRLWYAMLVEMFEDNRRVDEVFTYGSLGARPVSHHHQEMKDAIRSQRT